MIPQGYPLWLANSVGDIGLVIGWERGDSPTSDRPWHPVVAWQDDPETGAYVWDDKWRAFSTSAEAEQYVNRASKDRD